MKHLLLLSSILAFSFFSCGPSSEELARKQKDREDSLVNAALLEEQKKQDDKLATEVNEIQAQIADRQSELDGLLNDQVYVSNKKKLETVRARVSTGGSYGWIDGDGKFWEGKDASKSFDEAASQEAAHEEKIAAKKTEIKNLEDQLTHFEDIKSK